MTGTFFKEIESVRPTHFEYPYGYSIFYASYWYSRQRIPANSLRIGWNFSFLSLSELVYSSFCGNRACIRAAKKRNTSWDTSRRSFLPLPFSLWIKSVTYHKRGAMYPALKRKHWKNSGRNSRKRKAPPCNGEFFSFALFCAILIKNYDV